MSKSDNVVFSEVREYPLAHSMPFVSMIDFV